MTKIFRNILIATALLALTITGFWAALSHTATFGGKVSFTVTPPPAASITFAGEVTHASIASEADREFTYTFTDGGTNPSWDIPDIEFTTEATVVTYSFEFTNNAGTGEASVTITITPPSLSAPLTLTGGEVISTVATDGDHTRALAVGETVEFLYTLTLSSTAASVAETDVNFSVDIV